MDNLPNKRRPRTKREKPPVVSEKLTHKQELFCKLYTTQEFYGNGVRAYCAANNLDPANPKDYNTAKHYASVLLTNINIIQKINKELDDAGLNDNFVDKQLLFCITQNADLTSKVRAIEQYNKLKQRLIDKIDARLMVMEYKVSLNLE